MDGKEKIIVGIFFLRREAHISRKEKCGSEISCEVASMQKAHRGRLFCLLRKKEKAIREEGLFIMRSKNVEKGEPSRDAKARLVLL